MIVFPSGQTASQSTEYFDVFSSYIASEGIVSSVIIYPRSFTKVLANTDVLTKQTSLIPVPVQDPYSGTDDFLSAIKIMFSYIVRNAPNVIHIVTSGGTTKISTLAILTGNLAEKFGIKVRYLWVAKNSHGVYQINLSPKIVRKESDDFSITITPDGEVQIAHPTQSKGA